MAEITRFHPFEEMRTLANMLNRPLMPLMRSMASGEWSFEGNYFPMDVFDKNGKFIVKAALPGVHKADIDVTVEDGVLRINAKRDEEEEVRNEDYYLHEYKGGAMSRTLRLPEDVKANKIEAVWEEGVLTLTMPRIIKAGKGAPIKVAIR